MPRSGLWVVKLAAVAVWSVLLWPLSAPAQTCAGDCDGGGSVTVDEILIGLNIGLETRELADCASLDRNRNLEVTIEELIGAVNFALVGCREEPACDPLPVPAAATGVIGRQQDGTFLGHNGRRAGSTGPSVILDGVAQGFVTHPTLPLAYVSAYGEDGRQMVVVDLRTLEVVQEVPSIDPQGEAVLAPDGSRLFVPLGTNGGVVVVDVGPDGRLGVQQTIAVGERVVALHVSADGSTLWAGLFTEGELVAISLPSLEERSRISLRKGTWDILELEQRHELYISDLAGLNISIIDTTSDTVAGTIGMQSSPARMTSNADGSVVWVAVSGSDFVIAIDPATRTVTNHALVAEDDLVDDAGVPLPHSNPNAVAFEEISNRLYVSRGSDNAITVLKADTLEYVGALPTSWWPTDLEISPIAPGKLIVTEGQGAGSDPEPNGEGEISDINNGTLTVVDLSTLDLEATTAIVKQNQQRSIDRYPFDCASGNFPIPTRAGQSTPIEHVILVVKENKKFDAMFGDFDLPGIDAEPSLVRWTADVTPNHRKLAREFNLSDRFFIEAQESDSGHLFLTAGHLTEFTQRFFSEDPGSLGISWPLQSGATPDQGNLFSHLLDHGKTIRIYGEIVGTQVFAADGTRPSKFSDFNYPGGPIFSQSVLDRDRALYVVDRAAEIGLPDFLFMLLPNDHTEGTQPGRPTPESHVADNDEAIGILLDGISHLPELWQKTVIFILEDDPQGEGDHVSAARSFLIVASPWARRGGYVSHHQTSFLSVHATIARILGVPPLGRQIASAAPLWDLFTEEPDFRPYERLPRTHPYEFNQASAFGASASRRMDFRSPDRNPDLGRLLGLYRSWKLGQITREEAERRLAEPVDNEQYQELLEEAVEDTTAWEADFGRLQAWLATQGKTCLPDGRVVPLPLR